MLLWKPMCLMCSLLSEIWNGLGSDMLTLATAATVVFTAVASSLNSDTKNATDNGKFLGGFFPFIQLELRAWLCTFANSVQVVTSCVCGVDSDWSRVRGHADWDHVNRIWKGASGGGTKGQFQQPTQSCGVPPRSESHSERRRSPALTTHTHLKIQHLICRYV